MKSHETELEVINNEEDVKGEKQQAYNEKTLSYFQKRSPLNIKMVFRDSSFIVEDKGPESDYKYFLEYLCCPMRIISEDKVGRTLLSIILSSEIPYDRFGILRKQIIQDIVGNTSDLFKSNNNNPHYHIKSFDKAFGSYIIMINDKIFSRFKEQTIFTNILGLANIKDECYDMIVEKLEGPIFSQYLLSCQIVVSDFISILCQIIYSIILCHELDIRYKIDIWNARVNKMGKKPVYVGSDLILETRLIFKTPILERNNKNNTEEQIYEILEQIRLILINGLNKCKNDKLYTYISIVMKMMEKIKKRDIFFGIEYLNKIVKNEFPYAYQEFTSFMPSSYELFKAKTEHCMLESLEIEIPFLVQKHPLYIYQMIIREYSEDNNYLDIMLRSIQEIKRISLYLPQNNNDFFIKKELLRRYIVVSNWCETQYKYSNQDKTENNLDKELLEIRNAELYFSRMNKNRLVKISPRNPGKKRYMR